MTTTPQQVHVAARRTRLRRTRTWRVVEGVAALPAPSDSPSLEAVLNELAADGWEIFEVARGEAPQRYGPPLPNGWTVIAYQDAPGDLEVHH